MSIFDDSKSRKAPNITAPTMGGDVWWEVIRSNERYKLQRHKISRHCRILDSDNYRVANGSEASMNAEFERLEQHMKAGMSAKPSRFNVRAKTLGGKVVWEDIRSEKGYRVQKNTLTNHCRILNPDNVRIAYGTEKEMLQIFHDLIYGNTDELMLARTAPNIRMKTMGGEYCWETIEENSLYRLQKHFMGNCRIIDSRNVRVAFGSEEKMRAHFRRLTVMTGTVRIPRYGDIIGVKRINNLYDHYGVYENDDSVIEFSSQDGDFGEPIIHRTTLSRFIGASSQFFILIFPDVYGIPGKLYFSTDVPVAEKQRTNFLKFFSDFKNSINYDANNHVNNFADAVDSSRYYHLYSPEETVQRAKSCIGKTVFGEAEYDSVTENKKGYSLITNNCEHFAIWCKTGLRESHQIEGNFLKMARYVSFAADY